MALRERDLLDLRRGTAASKPLSILVVSALVVALTTTPVGADRTCRDWSLTPTQRLPMGSYFEDASGTSSTDAWAVGIDGNGNILAHWDRRSWRLDETIDSHTQLYDVAAISPTDAWAVGTYGGPHGGYNIARILHWDGTSWSVFPAPKGGSYAFLYSVSAWSATDVWAAGLWTDSRGAPNPLALHYDGTSWTLIPTASPTIADVFDAIEAVGPDDVWGVGYQEPELFGFRPLIEHWDGVAWSVVSYPSLPGDGFLYGVSGAASDDVWAVGPMDMGSLPPIAFHWDGNAWSQVTAAGTVGRLYGFDDVVAVTPDDVWVAGVSVLQDLTDRRPAVQHWDGTKWTITEAQSPGTSGGFYGIGASSSSDVWAVGYAYDFSFDPHPLAEHSSGPCPGD